MELISNQWFIAIGGSIVGGLLIAVLGRQISERFAKREYWQRVATANKELIYALRPSVAEKQAPEPSVTQAIISTTAGKYGVSQKHLYSPIRLANELAKEVMDNAFLSSEQKAEFCDFALVMAAGAKEETEGATQPLEDLLIPSRNELWAKIISLCLFATCMLASGMARLIDELSFFISMLAFSVAIVANFILSSYFKYREATRKLASSQSSMSLRSQPPPKKVGRTSSPW